MSLDRVLVVFLSLVLLVTLVPVGLVLERRTAEAIERRTHEDMAVMPRLLEARHASEMSRFMMYAREIASTPGLADAVERGDRAEAERLAESAGAALGVAGLLVTKDLEAWLGDDPGSGLVNATRAGEMPVEVVAEGPVALMVALAPLLAGTNWVGAAGSVVPLDRAEAGLLAGLSRADVVIVTADGRVAASSREGAAEEALLASLGGRTVGVGEVWEFRADGRRHLVASAHAGAVAVHFLRDLEAELAVLPVLRRIALLGGVSAMLLALLVGGLLSGTLVGPVRTLATAADRVAAGDFAAPLPRTRIREFRRVTDAFSAMRRALAQRVTELERANEALAARERRLTELQTELIRRDRLATAGQLVGQLAHEVRNPVANVRNCLELLSRRTADDDARELIELATDELLRMHELAERVLDLHRPAPRGQQVSDVAAVAHNVAALMRLSLPGEVGIHVTGPRSISAAIPPDTLKQILMTLLQNASEAMAGEGAVEIRVDGSGSSAAVEVTDTGPGIPEDVLPRIFDPFFTTKDGVQGVGLGLFVAEALLRSHGARVVASNMQPRGARFRIELPVPGSSLARGQAAAGLAAART